MQGGKCGSASMVRRRAWFLCRKLHKFPGVAGTMGSARSRIHASGVKSPKPHSRRKTFHQGWRSWRFSSVGRWGRLGTRWIVAMALHFSRVAPAIEELEIWSASELGYSFVISNESRSGPGLHGKPGFVASWRPINLNRTAIKVGGSPFKNQVRALQGRSRSEAFPTEKAGLRMH